MYTGLVGRNCICERPINRETSEKGVTDDTRFYTFDGTSGNYRLFKVTELPRREEDKFVKAREIRIQSWQPLHGCPDFGKVGVFRVRGYMDRSEEIISLSEIRGKVCIVENFAVTVPNIILFEAT